VPTRTKRIADAARHPRCAKPQSELTAATTPRLTGINTIPASLVQPPPPSTYPVGYLPGTEDLGYGIDQSLKTPYSYALDLSIQRQLPGRMTLDVAYVGHFAHRVLGLQDVAEPTDLVDPKSGIDYFSAAKRMSQLWRAGTPDNSSSITPAAVGPTAQYWQNMLTPQSSYPLCAAPGGATTNLLFAVYDWFGGGVPATAPNCGDLYNETSALYAMDIYGLPSTPVTGLNSFYNSQYSSLWIGVRSAIQTTTPSRSACTSRCRTGSFLGSTIHTASP
jgi:hypothetical protein